MGVQVLTYPFLFIAIFFEAFVLVTYLSAPAIKARKRGLSSSTPSVAIVIPCFNEAATVGATAASALALEYPKNKLEVILVDDGSTDNTREVMETFRTHSNIKIIYKENGGKDTALNAGIAATNADLVGCLDADSFVEPGSLLEMIPTFEDTNVAASTAAMSVHEPKNLIQHMQNAEYIFGIMLRHALSSVNGLYVTPGPFSFYRRSVINELGGFRHGHQTEDLEMALRIQKAGYKIENAPRARVYTKAPATVGKLLKQRTRWTTGFLRNVFIDYQSLIGNRSYGALGTIVLPIAIMAIGSGMLLFFIMLYLLISRIVHSIQVNAGIPFVLHAPTFDWFYFPASFYLFLVVLTVSTTLVMVAIGKRISATPSSLSRGLFAYILLYGFLAPVWLMRATSDIATGTKRRWR